MSIAKSRANGTAESATDAECARLQNQVKELEGQIATERKKNAMLQDERDDYYRALLAWSRSQITPEQLHQWSTETPAPHEQVSFEEVMAELRKKN